MRDHIKDAFARMNLQQFRSFLLYGTDDYADRTQPYRDTLEKESNPIFKRLEKLYPDGPELDATMSDLSQALTAHDYVYMELGMKAGARLIYELLIAED